MELRHVRLQELLDFPVGQPIASSVISTITADSRKAESATLFFALSGEHSDGHSYVQSALERGAACAVVREDWDGDGDATRLVRVPEPRIRELFALASKRLYAPWVDQTLCVGITGTNGKTSTAWIVAQALARLVGPTVYSGTLGIMCFDRSGQEIFSEDLSMTTPMPDGFFSTLRKLEHVKPRAIVAEVSSHAIVQKRLWSVPWRAAVFTNLTRDHLDYHKSFEAYGEAKALLFTRDLMESSARDRVAILNVDDEWGQQIAERCAATLPVVCFSRKSSLNAEVLLTEGHTDLNGSTLECAVGTERLRFKSKLIGDYNLENLLTAASTLVALGHSPSDVSAALEEVPPVPGRLERVGEMPFGIFVDYSHTPDALRRAQLSLREVTNGRLITVFGCGGDRDRGKRPQMGAEVARLSDVAIVTSDNPRSEDPDAIIAEILPGLSASDRRAELRVLSEPNRYEAIRLALAEARPGDAVLVAGKGHENYQEIQGERHPFLDRAVISEILSARHGNSPRFGGSIER